MEGGDDGSPLWRWRALSHILSEQSFLLIKAPLYYMVEHSLHILWGALTSYINIYYLVPYCDPVIWATVVPQLALEISFMLPLISLEEEGLGPLLLTWFNFNPSMDR